MLMDGGKGAAPTNIRALHAVREKFEKVPNSILKII